MLPQSAPGVFLDPQRVLNAASFAPAGYPVSPGGFITLFGSGLGTQAATAAIPFPRMLANVQVTVNGIAAPIYYVNPTQISAIVPYAVTGSVATVVAIVNGDLILESDVDEERRLAAFQPYSSPAGGFSRLCIVHLICG